MIRKKILLKVFKRWGKWGESSTRTSHYWKNVDFQPTNKETKENQTEVRLAQTYKNYKVYGQDLIVK